MEITLMYCSARDDQVLYCVAVVIDHVIEVWW